MKKVQIFLLFLITVFLIMPSISAVAASVEAEEEEQVIAQNDLLFQGIQGLIGGTANIIVGGDSPTKPDHIIAELVKVFNYGMMSVILLFMLSKGFFWIIQLSGNKKQDSLLDFQSAPVAVMMAVILLLPMPNGYSAIQHVVIKAAGLGISLANKESNVAADFLDRNASFTITPTIMNADKIALDMMDSAICMAMLNKVAMHTNVQTNNTLIKDKDTIVQEFTVTYKGKYTPKEAADAAPIDAASNYANGSTKSYSDTVCGSSTLRFGIIDKKHADLDIIRTFRDKLVITFNTLNTAINILGSNFVEYLLQEKSITVTGPEYNSTYPEDIEEQIRLSSEKFKLEYKALLNNLVISIRESEETEDADLVNNRPTQKLREYGAAYLGAYFWEFSKRNSIITSLTAVAKSSISPKRDEYTQIDPIPDDVINKISLNQSKMFTAINSSYLKELIDDSDDKYVTEYVERHIAQAAAKAETAYDYKMHFMFDWAKESLYKEADPVLALANLGNKFINLGAKAIDAIGDKEKIDGLQNEIKANINAITNKQGIEDALAIKLETLEGMRNILVIFIVFGALLAFWIPTIPLFHWVSGVIGFFIVFMQAILLTPLLAVAHLLSGEKGFLNSKTQHGYMSILLLITYMPIMVISFFVAYLVTMFGAKLLQIIYIPFMAILNGDTLTGLIPGIFITAIFILINIQIFNRGFALITTIPEKAGKFIGGGEEMLGDSQGVNQVKSSFDNASNQVARVGSTNAQSGINVAATKDSSSKNKMNAST